MFSRVINTPLALYRSSHQRCSIEEGVLKIFKIDRKTPVPESFFNKVTGLRPPALLKKETLAQVFSCEFCKILRTPFLQNTSGRLLIFVEILEILRS